MFRKDFLFGAATAAYQVEGAWDQGGKGISNWDTFSRIPGKTLNGTNGDVAVDHYNRYKEDVKLMAEMGLESYRFSIAWSRIFPKGDDVVNQEGIDFYNALIDECLVHGIVPFITLYHWDMPDRLQENGGWLSQETMDSFMIYADRCFKEFGDRVKHWITFNETVVFIRHGYIYGAHPPGRINQFKEYYQAVHNVFLTHAKAVLHYKETLNLHGDIGITHVFAPSFPVDDQEGNIKAADHVWLTDTWFYYDPILKGQYPQKLLDILKVEGNMIDFGQDDLKIMKEAVKYNDFMGINYYQPTRIESTNEKATNERSREASTGAAGGFTYDGKAKTVKLKEGVYTDWDWEISPQSLSKGLSILKERYGDIPFYITENGLGDKDLIVEGFVTDIARINFIKEHLLAIKESIDEGIDIRGYFAWSFIDLLSWLNGFVKQYGFVYVDHQDNLSRHKKASYYWYQKVIETRGENLK